MQFCIYDEMRMAQKSNAHSENGFDLWLQLVRYILIESISNEHQISMLCCNTHRYTWVSECVLHGASAISQFGFRSSSLNTEHQLHHGLGQHESCEFPVDAERVLHTLIKLIIQTRLGRANLWIK